MVYYTIKAAGFSFNDVIVSVSYWVFGGIYLAHRNKVSKVTNKYDPGI